MKREIGCYWVWYAGHETIAEWNGFSWLLFGVPITIPDEFFEQIDETKIVRNAGGN